MKIRASTQTGSFSFKKKDKNWRKMTKIEEKRRKLTKNDKSWRKLKKNDGKLKKKWPPWFLGARVGTHGTPKLIKIPLKKYCFGEDLSIYSNSPAEICVRFWPKPRKIIQFLRRSDPETKARWVQTRVERSSRRTNLF